MTDKYTIKVPAHFPYVASWYPWSKNILLSPLMIMGNNILSDSLYSGSLLWRTPVIFLAKLMRLWQMLRVTSISLPSFLLWLRYPESSICTPEGVYSSYTLGVHQKTFLLHIFMGLSSLTTEGLPIILWRSPPRGGTSMYSTDYCLKTCSPLSFGRISLAENNGNKRSAIITVTPGVEASGSVGSSTWHESPY